MADRPSATPESMMLVLILAVVALGCLTIGNSAHAQLQWAPPAQTDPQTVTITTPGSYFLTPGVDYIVHISNVAGPVSLSGGRHNRVIGGHISIPWQPVNSLSTRRALLISDCYPDGSFFLEGLLLDGEDITEGVDIENCSEGDVYIQNVRVENVHARDGVGFTDNHPDVVQTWDGLRSLKLDRVYGESNAHFSFMGSADGDIGRIDYRRVVMRQLDTPAGKGSFVWTWQRNQNRGPWPMTLSDVYVIRGSNNGRLKSIRSSLGDNGYRISVSDGIASWPGDSLLSGEIRDSRSHAIRNGLVPTEDQVGEDYVPIGYR